jgi:hypothetical protein
MTHTNLKLGTQPLKLTNDLTLFQNEKCLVKAATGTLTLPILIHDETRGQLFAGKGELTLDAIIETPKGAVRNSVVKSLTLPFLVFGPINDIEQKTTPATADDIKNVGYTGPEDFLTKANDLVNQFIGNSHSNLNFREDGHLLAFSNENTEWDILVSEGNKLVYTSKNNVYVSKGSAKSVVIQPDSVVVKRNGKTVVIVGDNVFVNKDPDHCCL